MQERLPQGHVAGCGDSNLDLLDPTLLLQPQGPTGAYLIVLGSNPLPQKMG